MSEVRRRLSFWNSSRATRLSVSMLRNFLSWRSIMLIILTMQMENFPNVSSLRMVFVTRLSRVFSISVSEDFLIWLIVVGFLRRILLTLSRMLEGMLIGKVSNRWIVVSLMIGVIRDPVGGRSLVEEILVLPLSATSVVRQDIVWWTVRVMIRSVSSVGNSAMWPMIAE